jgi:hypothetical protein
MAVPLGRCVNKAPSRHLQPLLYDGIDGGLRFLRTN